MAGAAFGQRELGQAIFIVGFYIATVGVVGRLVRLPLLDRFPTLRFGVRIVATGFCIATLGFLVTFLGLGERLGDAILLGGGVVLAIGAVKLLVDFVRVRATGPQ